MIMTSSEEKKNYEKITLSADVVESRLPTILIEGKNEVFLMHEFLCPRNSLN